ncbi:hypothetical protein J1N35_037346 [Gossypium stocksii]|uniref:Uncharacterized protein n=1 Tax=Gossypium stocksii TaxID=47602 RepID=A0A9D3ZLP3_9ROSI|nr:hypothetical protein J1N35_037346 [Gossypium stocksii]
MLTKFRMDTLKPQATPMSRSTKLDKDEEAIIMFNDITEAIERGINTNITLPHDTYLSYLFRRLGIRTHRDTLITSNQPISYEAHHHAGYHYDATTST